LRSAAIGSAVRQVDVWADRQAALQR